MFGLTFEVKLKLCLADIKLERMFVSSAHFTFVFIGNDE